MGFFVSQGTLKDTLVEVRPTTFLGVPRVYEKMYAALREKEASLGTFGKFVFKGAMKIGSREAASRKNGYV